MPRIPLTLSISYVPDWRIKEGLRELLQNHLDTQDDTGVEGSISYRSGTLRLKNPGAAIDRNALLLGMTTKADRDDQRGQWGEGLKLAALALARDGCSVEVRTPTEIWKAALEESDDFAGETVLVWNIRARPNPSNNEEAVEVVVRGLERHHYEELKQQFLFFQDPKDVEDLGYHGCILWEKRFRGQVYVKGIKAMNDERLAFGYDLRRVDLDRDRRIIGNWDLCWAVSNLVKDSMSAAAKMTGEQALELLESNTKDVEHFNDATRYDSAASEKVAAAFKEKYGEDAVPAKDSAQSMKLGHFNKRGIVVPEALRLVLEQAMGQTKDLVDTLGKAPKSVYAIVDLTVMERAALQWAVYQLSKAVPVPQVEGIATRADNLLALVRVVDFHSETTLGLYRSSFNGVDIARSELSDRFKALSTLVHEFAHMLTDADDGSKAHIYAVEEIWTALARHWGPQ